MRTLSFLVFLTLVACDHPPASTTDKSADKTPATALPSAPKGSVTFAYPQDGCKVFSEFDVIFAVDGMTVRPAGEDALDRTSGHHHLIIDGEAVAAGMVVPADATHIHFGKGQTTAHQSLAPGKHTLTLQFADGAHLSYGPAFSKTIHVEVVAKPAKLGVSFAAPKDGAELRGKTTIKFLVDGMTLAPAGENALDKTAGHHHLIIDGEPVALGTVVPADAQHLHFGKAQTETQIELPKGPHTLTLQFADGAHLSYGPAMSATIHVNAR